MQALRYGEGDVSPEPRECGTHRRPPYDPELTITRWNSTPPLFDISEVIFQRFVHTLLSIGVCQGAYGPDVDVHRLWARAQQEASRC